MTEDYGETVRLEDQDYIQADTEKRDNKIWIILAVVGVILLCCCIGSILGVVWLWTEGGDLLLENLGLSLIEFISFF